MKLVYLFTSKTCGKCQMIKPAIKDLISRIDNVSFHEIETDKREGFKEALKYEVISLPTLIIFENGKEEKRFVSSFNIKDVEDALN